MMKVMGVRYGDERGSPISATLLLVVARAGGGSAFGIVTLSIWYFWADVAGPPAKLGVGIAGQIVKDMESGGGVAGTG